jgi:NAD(P)-dependent dehydrogenase (short-subunit alcohol dehydrogenase family)
MSTLLEHRVPMRRMAQPQELAGAVLFLAGARASFVTGVILPVDGGWTAS